MISQSHVVDMGMFGESQLGVFWTLWGCTYGVANLLVTYALKCLPRTDSCNTPGSRGSPFLAIFNNYLAIPHSRHVDPLLLRTKTPWC